MYKLIIHITIVLACCTNNIHAQIIVPSSKEKFNVVNRHISIYDLAGKKIVHLDTAEGADVAWLNNINFSKGVIEFDVKGKDVLQQSFVGIAFHGINDTAYDAIYFRPFNFNSTDTTRKNHSVQYISMPQYDWSYLREKFPNQYENKLTQSIDANSWFHAKIVASAEVISVFVNDDDKPSLTVKPLNNYTTGKVGFWAGHYSDGDFANLIITKKYKMKKTIITAFLFFSLSFYATAQKTKQYNLAELVKNNQLLVDTSNHLQILNDNVYKDAISTQKIVWLKDVFFKKGTIDIDLRGKDVFLQSFLGVAFHAADANHYELVYFRPFNFQYPDTARRRWSLQYMVIPDYPYNKLRQEHPLVYENSITPPPKATGWFHATIVIKDDSIKVYVNHSAQSSLEVKKLGTSKNGMIGLWDDELSGDFANLTIKQNQ